MTNETGNRERRRRALAAGALLAFFFLAGGAVAWAAQDNQGLKIAEGIDGSLKSGYAYLKTAAALVVGGGFLAAGGRAMTRGDWTGGSIAVGFGILVLIAFFALGKTLGLSQ